MTQLCIWNECIKMKSRLWSESLSRKSNVFEFTMNDSVQRHIRKWKAGNRLFFHISASFFLRMCRTRICLLCSIFSLAKIFHCLPSDRKTLFSTESKLAFRLLHFFPEEFEYYASEWTKIYQSSWFAYIF